MAENRIDYTARDYDSLLAQLLAKKSEKLPNYSEVSDNDLGILLIQLFAMMGDMLGYYIDRIVSEAFLSEASERPSVIKLAQLLGYVPTTTQGASVDVKFFLSTNPGGTTLLKGTQVATARTSTEEQKIFSLDNDLVIPNPDLDGTGSCTHGTNNVENFTGNGLPAQQFRLLNSPVVSGKVDVVIDSVTWTEVANLADKADVDEVYIVFYQEDKTAVVVFGDGVFGKIPPNSSNIDITYIAGGGVEGRVEVAKIDVYLGPVTTVSSVTNLAASSGGSDQEGIGSIKVNAPAFHKTSGRAVAARDYETLSLAVSGVRQAKAIEYGGFVRVSIVPTGGGLPSVGLKNSVTTELDQKRPVGTHVVVEDPVFISVDITVVCVAEPGFKQSVVQLRVENTLKAFLDPDFTEDGVYVNGYGVDLFLSEVYQVINDVFGVERCTISVLKKTTEASGSSDIDLREIEIRTIGTISVTVLEGLENAEFEDSIRKIKNSKIV